VINGGTVISEACSFSGDAGIDSDMGIHINGGTVIATGNMLDRISESAQNYAVFHFASSQKEDTVYTLKNESGDKVIECSPKNSFTYLIVSSANMTAGTYTLWQGETQLARSKGNNMRGFGGGQLPEGMERPEGGQIPEGIEFPEGGQMPEGMTPPDGKEHPEGQRPGGGKDGFGDMRDVEVSTEFVIEDGGSYFSNVSIAE